MVDCLAGDDAIATLRPQVNTDCVTGDTCNVWCYERRALSRQLYAALYTRTDAYQIPRARLASRVVTLDC